STVASRSVVLIPRPPTSPLFPYTTLFRSVLLPDAPLLVLLRSGWPVELRALQYLLAVRLLFVLPVAGLHGVTAVSAHRHRDVSEDRKSTRLNSSHVSISYAVFCLKKKNTY